jgi:hypothetical protein
VLSVQHEQKKKYVGEEQDESSWHPCKGCELTKCHSDHQDQKTTRLGSSGKFCRPICVHKFIGEEYPEAMVQFNELGE